MLRDVTRSQLAFALFIAICVALHPGEVLKSNEGGVSNYGAHLKTIIPYTVAFSLASALSYRATRSLHTARLEARHFKTLLLAYAALTLLTLVTTYGYTLDRPQRDVHVAAGALITIFEFSAALWMYVVLRRFVVVLLVACAGLVLAALTFFGVLHVLFLTQILIGGSFAFLLVRTSREVA